MDPHTTVESTESAPGPPVDVPVGEHPAFVDSMLQPAVDHVHELEDGNHERRDAVAGTAPSLSTAHDSSDSAQFQPGPDGIPDQLASYTSVQVHPCDMHGMLGMLRMRSSSALMLTPCARQVIPYDHES